MTCSVLALTSLAEAVSRAQSVGLLTALVLPAVATLWWRGRRDGDRTTRAFCGYALALLGVFWVHQVADLRAADAAAALWRRALSNVIQLPYAWLFVRLVRCYFDVDRTSSRWSLWLRGVERAYWVPVGLIGVDLVADLGVASWSILLLNLANLLSAYVAVIWCWRLGVRGAGAFLAGMLPMALGGLLLALQWAVEPGGYGINGMFPFWLGVLLHLMVFFVVLHKSAPVRTKEALAA